MRSRGGGSSGSRGARSVAAGVRVVACAEVCALHRRLYAMQQPQDACRCLRFGHPNATGHQPGEGGLHWRINKQLLSPDGTTHHTHRWVPTTAAAHTSAPACLSNGTSCCCLCSPFTPGPSLYPPTLWPAWVRGVVRAFYLRVRAWSGQANSLVDRTHEAGLVCSPVSPSPPHR